MLQFLESCQQVRHRSAPSVQPPHQHHIDFAAARRLQQLLPQLPLRGAATDLFHLHSDSPAPPGGVFAECADLQWNSLLVVRGAAGVETGAGHFRWFPCLAKKPTRFRLFRCLFGGHSEMSLLHGRRLSFSAMQDSAYPMPHPRGIRSAPASRGSSKASTPTVFASCLLYTSPSPRD